jgi:cleavage and polyadenylation specificity factor subunit 1
LQIFDLPKLTQVYSTDAFPLLPSLVTDEFVPRRYVAKESLSELVMADVGDDTAKTPLLILRTGMDDLVIYQAFHPQGSTAFTTGLRWTKLSQPRLSRTSDDAAKKDRRPKLRHLPNVAGYSTVFQRGANPRFVLKEASSAARVIPLRGDAIAGIGALNAAHCDRGFALLDAQGGVRMCQLPPGFRYGDTGWPTHQVPLGQEVSGVAYLADRDVYVVATSEDVPFRLPDDDHHKEWQNEGTAINPRGKNAGTNGIDLSLLPVTRQGYLKMLRPGTWKPIYEQKLRTGDTCLSLTVANLEASERTRDRRWFVCAGTATVLGEDQATRGNIYVLDVHEVVAAPDADGKMYKFSEVAREDVRGAVSQLAPIGPRGFLLAAQGQKCMVRGLVEKDKLLPVAFLDAQCYVTSARVLPGSAGMAVLGDVAKGVWFVGYTVRSIIDARHG